MSLSSLPEVRCSSYCFAKPELLCVPGITTSSAIQRRMSKEQNWRTGLLTALSKSAMPFLSGLDSAKSSARKAQSHRVRNLLFGGQIICDWHGLAVLFVGFKNPYTIAEFSAP